MSSMQFAPWSSDIELGFYAALSNLKINHDKLDDSARRVLGLYQVRPEDTPERSARMQIFSNSLTSDEVAAGYYRAEGWIKNFNTFEEYKSSDRAKVLELAGRTIWDAINDETIYSCPSLLCSFYAISFANLKKYKFTYHFAFPALHSDPPWKIASGPDRLSPKETTLLVESVQTWRYSVDARQHGFFLAKRVPTSKGRQQEHDDAELSSSRTVQSSIAEELGFSWSIGSISSFKTGFFTGVAQKDRFVAFADPSNFPSNPGWMLRNYLVLIRKLWKLEDVQVLCYRDTHARREHPNSIIFHLQSAQSPSPVTQAEGAAAAPLPKITGWERTLEGKLISRTVDLAPVMDPARLADEAVDLNLKLIKWRIAPTINLDIIKKQSCLLLGAGTLGSYVARILMAWGVRKITFVDSATVSFSNPVRQPLFRFDDCLNGGALKAVRAAEALKEIYPGVETRGEVMSVPMAGHPILDEAKTKHDFEKLKALIDEHDAVFLLLDTRESRWLPTLMGKAAGKMVLNAALGFDTFVVMRQGLKASKEGEVELGCYFCNDVVAPADSLKDATLDQQCTVTRPAVAPIAAGYLVDLFVSILQHPLGANAPAATTSSSSSSSGAAARLSGKESSKTAPESDFVHPLGDVPHQLRGFMSSFNNLQIVGAPYPHCSACSDPILQRYQEEGWDFVKRAVNERGWVEEVSGLAEVQRRAEELAEDVDWEEEDEGEEEGEGELI